MSMKYVRIYMSLAHCPPVEKIFWSYRHGYMPSLWYWYSVRQPFFSVYHSTIRYSFSPKNLNLLCQWVSMPVIPFFPFSSFVTGLICLFPLKLGRKKLKLNHISLSPYQCNGNEKSSGGHNQSVKALSTLTKIEDNNDKLDSN